MIKSRNTGALIRVDAVHETAWKLVSGDHSRSPFFILFLSRVRSTKKKACIESNLLACAMAHIQRIWLICGRASVFVCAKNCFNKHTSHLTCNRMCWKDGPEQWNVCVCNGRKCAVRHRHRNNISKSRSCGASSRCRLMSGSSQLLPIQMSIKCEKKL